MIKLLSVVGARPQFIKAAVVSRDLRKRDDVSETIVHTGQHFDSNMSDVFFAELDIPVPDWNLGIGSGTHGQNTGRMIEAVESIMLDESPDGVVVYGDTDSTLAGAIAAVKLQIPVAHVEAGLRSHNRRMPEEINRVCTDHISSLLFAPTPEAVNNLAAEGIAGSSVHLTGDVMYDAALHYGRRAEEVSGVLDKLGLEQRGYVLATVHRPSNTDDPERLSAIVDALARSHLPAVWPLHPRTRDRLAAFDLVLPRNVRAVDPVSYLDMVGLERAARVIVTDSGGVQKEAYFHRVPCITLRSETEWVELVEIGVNTLVADDWSLLAHLLTVGTPTFPDVDEQLYGAGDAGPRIASTLADEIGQLGTRS